MALSKAEVHWICKRARKATGTKKRAGELRRMLNGLAQFEPKSRRKSPFAKLCATGVEYAWSELERTIQIRLISQLSPPARASAGRNLQRTLEWITRPCFDLEEKSLTLALEALGLAGSNTAFATRKFWDDQPGHRLFRLFEKFPVLAALWSVAISQWREHLTEVLTRAARDRRAIARAFFGNVARFGRITDLKVGLSDRHQGGRSVSLVDFDGRRVIYKPRSGASEAIWRSMMEAMNRAGFLPKLRAVGILRRKNYCWMEYVETTGWKSPAGAKRFYERLGGIIAAAYLLKAVDCHRENVIIAGEDPVLVDIDALWHVSPVTKTKAAADVLYGTGFFPSPQPKSLQSRSSVLRKIRTGARIGFKPGPAIHYSDELIEGFVRGWKCLCGTAARRSALSHKIRRIRAQKRRWVYRATEEYEAILGASIQPAALQSGKARDALITRLCRRAAAVPTVAAAESKALRQLDLPYFVRTTTESMPADEQETPPELIRAIREAWQWA